MKFEVFRTRQKQDEPEKHCVKHTFPKYQGTSCVPDSGKLVTVAAFKTPYKLGTFEPPHKCKCGCSNLMIVPDAKGMTDGLFY